jgi:hypothetical protein
VAFLPAVAARFENGHAFNAHFEQGVFTESSLEGWSIASIFCINPKTSREAFSR